MLLTSINQTNVCVILQTNTYLWQTFPDSFYINKNEYKKVKIIKSEKNNLMIIHGTTLTEKHEHGFRMKCLYKKMWPYVKNLTK